MAGRGSSGRGGVQPFVGHLRGGEVEVGELRQSLEVRQPFVGHFGVTEVEGGQLCREREVRQAIMVTLVEPRLVR